MSRSNRLARGQNALRWTGLFCCALVALSLLAGCSRTGSGLTITGSTSVTPFMEHLAEQYTKAHPGMHINVQGLGSSAGIQAALNGTAALGMSSRSLTEEEAAQLNQLVIAYDALAIVVHPSNPVQSLKREDIRRIFDGDVVQWDTVGGRAEPITLISREAGSGTYSAFQELLMDGHAISTAALRQGSNGAIRQIIADDPDALGYISLGIVDASVKAVAIDGVTPSAEHVLANTYQLVRPFLLVWRKDQPLDPDAQQFLTFLQSPEAREELVRGGLITPEER
jgi:phosphate transport system substrate-binding protein